MTPDLPRIPRDRDDDFGPEAVEARLDYARERAGRVLPYLGGEPVPPGEARGNVENLVGFAARVKGLALGLGKIGARVQATAVVALHSAEVAPAPEKVRATDPLDAPVPSGAKVSNDASWASCALMEALQRSLAPAASASWRGPRRSC